MTEEMKKADDIQAFLRKQIEEFKTFLFFRERKIDPNIRIQSRFIANSYHQINQDIQVGYEVTFYDRTEENEPTTKKD